MSHPVSIPTHIRECQEVGEERLVFEGDFDLFSAIQVLEVVRSTRGHVDIEFSHVTAVRDRALQVLSDVLTVAGPERVTIHGLGDHQWRILHYLDTGRPAASRGAYEVVQQR